MQIKSIFSIQTLLILSIPLILCLIWLKSPVAEGLWLDESITAWIVQGSFQQVISRSTEYQGQSPFYFMILHIILGADVSSEVFLRLPSFILFVATAGFVYGIARHWFPTQTALLSVIFFCSMDEMLKVAISARPYALALFGSLGALFFLLKWIQSKNLLHGLAYLLFLLTSFYAHFIFTPILVVHLVAFWSEKQPRRRLPFYHLIIAWIAFGIGTLPFVMQFLSLAGRHDTLYFAVSPGLSIVASTFLPPYILVYLIAAALMAAIFGIGRGLYIPLSGLFQGQNLLTLLSWYIFPVLLFLSYSLLSGHSLFLPRLFSWYLPALAILLARILTSIRPQAALVPAVVVCLGMILFRELLRQWHVEDWRSIAHHLAAELDPDQRVLLFPGLIEVEQDDWQRAPEMGVRGQYMRAPFTHYHGPRSDLISLKDREEFAEALSQRAADSFPPYFVSYRMSRSGLDGASGYVHDALLEALRNHQIYAEEIQLKKQKKPTVLLYKLTRATTSTQSDPTENKNTEVKETEIRETEIRETEKAADNKNSDETVLKQ